LLQLGYIAVTVLWREESDIRLSKTSREVVGDQPRTGAMVSAAAPARINNLIQVHQNRRDRAAPPAGGVAG
jgi:hypothetical protein